MTVQSEFSLPLGAATGPEGTNFSLFSGQAEKAELLLFDDPGDAEPSSIVELQKSAGPVWHAHVPEAGPGQLYAFRIHGPFDPDKGRWCNPHKAVLDPYARAITGDVLWNDALYSFRRPRNGPAWEKDDRDSAAYLPKCVVVDTTFDWEGDSPPGIPWDRTVIYETHIKNFTAKLPGLDPSLRGTYAAMGSPKALGHLRKLGVTAIELLPVQQHFDESVLAERGLQNAWGYSTIGFFAPDFRYSGSGSLGGQVAEFKRMVKALHAAGIEVILDVVYNHTPEGNQEGPVFCFKGIDAAAYYAMDESGRFLDVTGTGNTLAIENSWTRRLVLDSLRYWAGEMRVDGFRFDLAVTLGREKGQFNSRSAFFRELAQDRVLSRVKIIAEPWDIAADGYQVGHFPAPWREWNDQFRDGLRRFWNGFEPDAQALRKRMTGSPDLFPPSLRHPETSVNFVTCHDGFTLNDLVSYNEKHNQANLEENKDGSAVNYSWNCGVEGPSNDANIKALRFRQMKNFLASLLLARGIPMLSGGDEIARSQNGNNNAYCQDNETTRFHWDLDSERKDLLRFTRRLIELRRRVSPLAENTEVLQWSLLDAPSPAESNNKAALGLAWINTSGSRYALLMNGSKNSVQFELPAPVRDWRILLSSLKKVRAPRSAGNSFRLEAHALALLQAKLPVVSDTGGSAPS